MHKPVKPVSSAPSFSAAQILRNAKPLVFSVLELMNLFSIPKLFSISSLLQIIPSHFSWYKLVDRHNVEKKAVRGAFIN